MSKVKMAAQVRAKSGGLREISIDQALELAEREIETLKAWLKTDPNSPYRDEAAARLQTIAKRIRRPK